MCLRPWLERATSSLRLRYCKSFAPATPRIAVETRVCRMHSNALARRTGPLCRFPCKWLSRRVDSNRGPLHYEGRRGSSHMLGFASTEPDSSVAHDRRWPSLATACDPGRDPAAFGRRAESAFLSVAIRIEVSRSPRGPGHRRSLRVDCEREVSGHHPQMARRGPGRGLSHGGSSGGRPVFRDGARPGAISRRSCVGR
jgi:hypothetical protein